jgi:hypothetical protein
MKYLYTYQIFEKSSLSTIGIPKDILPLIERDYEIPGTAQWEKTSAAKLIYITYMLTKGEPILFIHVSPKKVTLISSQDIEFQRYFYIEEYQLIEDDFGATWERNERITFKPDTIVKQLNTQGQYYYLQANDFKIDSKKKRKVTNYVAAYDIQLEDIVSKLKTHLRKAKIPVDLEVKANSLSDFDEKILGFEDEISTLRNDYITVLDLYTQYGEKELMRALIYYFKTGKIIEFLK